MQGFFASSSVQTTRQGPALVPKCGACRLFKHCDHPKMEVHGGGARKVMIVGEYPSAMDDEIGRPFLGSDGQYLRSMLESMDIDLDKDAWSTNALICRSRKDGYEAAQIDYCRPNLLNAIRLYEPRVIVTLGRAPLVSVLAQHWADVGPLERWVGWAIPLERHWICPTYHPTFLMRQRNSLMERQFADHLEEAFAFVEPAPPLPDFDKRIELLYNDEEVYEAVRDIDRAGGWAAVDYESNCLKPEYPLARISSCAISNGVRTISFLWLGRAIEAVGRFLSSRRTRKIASNLKFEERWTLKTFGHGVNNWGWDTMLAAHCLDNRQGICSLKFQALVKMGVPSYNDNIDPYLTSAKGSFYNRIQEIGTRDLLFYGGMDALLEFHLAKRQRKEFGYAD